MYVDYYGDKTKLSKSDQRTLTQHKSLYIDIPMNTYSPGRRAQTWDPTSNVRELISSTYPSAANLSDVATLSTIQIGRYPKHPASSSRSSFLEGEAVLGKSSEQQDATSPRSTVILSGRILRHRSPPQRQAAGSPTPRRLNEVAWTKVQSRTGSQDRLRQDRSNIDHLWLSCQPEESRGFARPRGNGRALCPP